MARGAIIRGRVIIRGLFRDNLQHWMEDFARLLTVQFTSNEGMSNDAPYPRGGGGMLRISSDGDDRMGAKTKTSKTPRVKN